MKCPVCGNGDNRSNEQNKRYWKILTIISERLKTADGYHSTQTWHLYFRERYLGCEDYSLPNRKTITIPKSTAGLDVGEFNEYMTQVEAFANEHGVYLDE